jgi:hypothetical protein
MSVTSARQSRVRREARLDARPLLLLPLAPKSGFATRRRTSGCPTLGASASSPGSAALSMVVLSARRFGPIPRRSGAACLVRKTRGRRVVLPREDQGWTTSGVRRTFGSCFGARVVATGPGCAADPARAGHGLAAWNRPIASVQLRDSHARFHRPARSRRAIALATSRSCARWSRQPVRRSSAGDANWLCIGNVAILHARGVRPAIGEDRDSAAASAALGGAVVQAAADECFPAG